MPTPLLIVQARMESTRFPGKVLHPLLGQPMILWHLAQLAQCETPCTVVVASPDTPANYPLKNLCEKHGHRCELLAGDPNDVLARYMQVVGDTDAEIVVRTTADCPLMDPALVDEMLALFTMPDLGLDHLGIADTWPDGVDCEMMTRGALEIADSEARRPSEREHVTPYLWTQPERFACFQYPCLFNLGTYQWSVDTPADARYVEQLLELLMRDIGLGFRTFDTWQILRQQPDLQRAMERRKPRNHAYVTQMQGEGHTHVTTWANRLGSNGHEEAAP